MSAQKPARARLHSIPRRATVRLARPLAVSGRLDLRVALCCVGLTLTGVAVLSLSLAVGEFPLPPGRVVATLLGQGAQADEFIVLTLRLPRALVAILAGAALAVSGHLFQTLVRNPLASPDIIGVTSGAALVAVGIVVLGASSLLIPMGALAGATVAATVIYLLAWRDGLSPYRFVLVGVGIAAICQAATSYLLVRGELADVQQAAVWLVGSLNGRSWAEVWPLTVALALLLPVAAVLARSLDALSLGEDAATALGVRVGHTRLGLVAVATVLAAVAVAATGPVGFVAFIASHIARRLADRTGGAVLPVAALSGAVLVLMADLVAGLVLAPTQLPAGIVTSVLGAPYFLFLLQRANRTGAAA